MSRGGATTSGGFHVVEVEGRLTSVTLRRFVSHHVVNSTLWRLEGARRRSFVSIRQALYFAGKDAVEPTTRH